MIMDFYSWQLIS